MNSTEHDDVNDSREKLVVPNFNSDALNIEVTEDEIMNCIKKLKNGQGQTKYAQSDQSLCLSLEYSMTVELLTAHHLLFESLKGGAQARLSLHLSKCHIVGNFMA